MYLFAPIVNIKMCGITTTFLWDKGYGYIFIINYKLEILFIEAKFIWIIQQLPHTGLAEPILCIIRAKPQTSSINAKQCYKYINTYRNF